MSVETYYSVLDVAETATQQEIKAAYRDLVRQIHPDFLPGASAYWKRAAEEKTKEIHEAYGVLSDPTLRREYDRLLKEARRDKYAAGAVHSSTPPSQPPNPPPTSGPQSASSYCLKCGGPLYAGSHCTQCRKYATPSSTQPVNPNPTPWAPLAQVALVAWFLICIYYGIIGPLQIDDKVAPSDVHDERPPNIDEEFNEALAASEEKLAAKPVHPGQLKMTWDEKMEIELVCLPKQSTYRDCLSSQIGAWATGPKPDWSHLTLREKRWIEGKCFDFAWDQGPAAYNKCLVNLVRGACRRRGCATFAPSGQTYRRHHPTSGVTRDRCSVSLPHDFELGGACRAALKSRTDAYAEIAVLPRC